MLCRLVAVARHTRIAIRVYVCMYKLLRGVLRLRKGGDGKSNLSSRLPYDASLVRLLIHSAGPGAHGSGVQSLLFEEDNVTCSNYYSSPKTLPCPIHRAVFPSIATHTLIIENEVKP